MFVGEYSCKLDNKGRVLFPAALKRQLPADQQEHFVLKRDVYEQCLVLYPIQEWEMQNRAIRKKLNPFNREHALFLREFHRGTAEIFVDSSNRILIPRRLLESLGENLGDLVFAGQDGKIEIWGSSQYQAKKAGEGDFANLAERILGGDFFYQNED